VSKPPKGSAAMKAVLTDERFSNPDWIFERKLDGIRCIAVRDGGEVKLWSRNDLDLNGRWPQLATALEKQPRKRFAIDGEVVALEHGQTKFGSLGKGGKHIFFYVFDVLWLDGEDVREQPLRERKRLLKEAIEFEDPVRWTAHRNTEGEAMYEEACRKGWEGVIAKRADSPYATTRSKDWLKFKCEMGQELVIGGYTAPKGSRTDLGAILVGYYDDRELRYAGKVGTGFDRETLKDLRTRLEPLRRDTTPFIDAKAFKNVTWVEPKLVAQIGFSEWTGYGKLRHPRYLGLRIDKPASQVVREG
jgi:bifunctional non-homologous end joining protein LigD